MADLQNKRVTVAGLGHFGGGIAVARWLVEQGARVLVTDKESPEKLHDALAQLQGLPIEYRLGEHRLEDFVQADLIVASPAIPPSNVYLQAARDAGVPITTEILQFVQRCPARVIGVTGTKGKSTTSAMIFEILRRSQTRVWLGGNIGKSLLFDLPKMTAADIVVLELSSYMLHYLGQSRWSPQIAVVTMVSKDHIAWHGSVEAYLDDKTNLVRYQDEHCTAVLNEEDTGARAFADHSRARVVYFGREKRRHFDLLLPGWHNQLNAQAAFTTAALLGITWDQAAEALQDFRGLPHRLEVVHHAGGVKYYNDSIATIPEAAVAALESFPTQTVIQIVGGADKGLSIDAMCAALAQRAKAVLCIGQTGPSVHALLRQSQFRQEMLHECVELDKAVALARRLAVPEDVILLSPGFASQDQFINFEDRGNQFTKLARGT